MPINQNQRDQRNNNHDDGEYSKSKAVPPTERSPIAPANRCNVAGVHLSFFKRAFDDEQASRALAFDGYTENSSARPHLPPSRLIHLVLAHHGALLLAHATNLVLGPKGDHVVIPRVEGTYSYMMTWSPKKC